ncbi:MAG: phospholipase A [Gallionella sp.]
MQHEKQELLTDEMLIKAQRRSQSASRSYLTRVWNLDNRNHSDQNSLDRLRPHRLNYVIIRKTSNTNTQPSTPSAGHNVLTPYDLDSIETKFQLSFKTDIVTQENLNILGLKTVRLWGAYTQQSNWQMFNTRNSSPFRETNYEPELIAAFGTGRATGWKILNLGFVHQSNGRSNPGSRSWNRLYAQGGWEWNNTSLMARGWWRLPENALKDDNPDIIHYMGHGDVVLRWAPDNKSQVVSVLLRNNLNFNQNFGFVQLDWSLPVALGKAARLHAQITNGYGASLIDYNHRQTTLGLGVSFREW